ncbi:hypothetical protein ACFQVD_25030 [Streptosporangium amethystogenes subsp. fukuiense]|uniref:Uncharacterized protein n=1 Tax=Streptosporangium amethystogenes subsp. fukuiense TaxID=698418 RepID=A0ABW2T4M9_9ACTN
MSRTMANTVPTTTVAVPTPSEEMLTMSPRANRPASRVRTVSLSKSRRLHCST